MPTIEENLNTWNRICQWPQHGDEWSEAWGTSAAQWYFTLLPRIRDFLPADTILEIGPGHGRWSQFLKTVCTRLILVDLSDTCIEACKKRFGSDNHIAYHTNDGVSLAMIPDRSVDFVFSFDSLVHVEADVVQGYLRQIARKLKDGGGGFIHHSNLRSLPRLVRLIEWSQRHGLYKRSSFVRNQEHWRAHSMDASLFRSFCEEGGLACTKQELVNWVGTRLLIDCLSTFVRGECAAPKQCRLITNPDFMSEAKHARWLSKNYG